jgi:lipopolysaccharide assembly outer membrane protein LptD (OstA)
MKSEVRSMKRLALISLLAVLAMAQEAIRHGDVAVSAKEVQSDWPITHLTGNITIETDAFVLRADSADYNHDTNEITPHGDVHLKLKQ